MDFIPLDNWVQTFVDWLTTDYRWFFQSLKKPVHLILENIVEFLTWVPPSVAIPLIVLIAWQSSGIKVAIFSAFALSFIFAIGVWEPAMVTLSIVLAAVFLCVVIGIPIGILIAQSDRAFAIIRPILDIMQTMPSFVYLVPVVMLIGIGNTPGVLVTTLYALPPIIRLTNLGLRQVPTDMIEAGFAFGSSPRQVLFKIKIPLAITSIMAGLNQTIMMALGMVVIASMIAVEGLGMLVLQGIGRLDVGVAALGGIGIVLLAMVLDRVSQGSAGDPQLKKEWSSRGPVGLVKSLTSGISRS